MQSRFPLAFSAPKTKVNVKSSRPGTGASSSLKSSASDINSDAPLDVHVAKVDSNASTLASSVAEFGRPRSHTLPVSRASSPESKNGLFDDVMAGYLSPQPPLTQTGSIQTEEPMFHYASDKVESVSATPFDSQDRPRLQEAAPELQRLSENFDKWTGLMKKAIMSEFLALAQDHLLELGRQKDQHGSELLSQKNQIGLVNKELEKTKTSLDRKERLVETFVIKNAIGPKKTLLRRYFENWHTKCVKIASVTVSRYVFANHIARQHHRKALTKKVMKAWIHDVMKLSWKKRLTREAKTNFSEELTNVRSEYDNKLEKMKQHNDSLDAQLQLALAERARYAEEMKKALLRGVCALNIETMSVFGQQGKGDENLPNFSSNPALYDPLPFPPDQSVESKIKMPHLPSASIPLKESTNWGNRSNTPSEATVLAHRHLSDYVDLHRPPPPPASLVRQHNPGSLHVAHQFLDSDTVIIPAPLNHRSNATSSRSSPVRSRSPDHLSVLHNYKTVSGAETAIKPRQTPVGRIVRPAVDQALKGPIGLVTVRDSGRAPASSASRSKGIRVERANRS